MKALEPGDNTGQALQNAINALPAGGGTVVVPCATYNFGTKTVSLPPGKNKVELRCEPGTIFWYQGPAAALQVGADSANIEYFSLSNCEISLIDNPNPDAVALKLVRSFWGRFDNIKLTSSNRASASQTAVVVSGGATDQAGFSAYNLFSNCAVVGGFKKGYWFGSEIPGGPSTQDRSNANLILGGSVWCGAQDRTGTIGIHVQHGDTNRVIGTDHDSWEVGTKIDGHNNQINARYENIFHRAVWVGSTSMGSYINGCSIPAGEWQDDGFETQYVLTSQAGVNTTMLSDLRARYSFQLVPRTGEPANLADGMLWSDGNTIKARIAGRTETVAGAAMQSASATPLYLIALVLFLIALALVWHR
jgi:hypothetical protein